MNDGSRQTNRKPATRQRDIVVAAACGVFVAFMVAAAYAAVPLYTWFCRETGFGGTPQISKVAPAGVLERRITVRFDANVGPGLPWRFAPEVNAIDLRIGEVATVYYTVINESARVTEGQAAYNVSPPTAGVYFTKINCFCFTQQRMDPGEKRQMAVVFYVDPAMVKDSEQDDLNTITLSYTFYPVPVANAPTRPAAAGTEGRVTTSPHCEARATRRSNPAPHIHADRNCFASLAMTKNLIE
jgi:cytochrome c oxidase assembly protein subunit 11